MSPCLLYGLHGVAVRPITVAAGVLLGWLTGPHRPVGQMDFAGPIVLKAWCGPTGTITGQLGLV